MKWGAAVLSILLLHAAGVSAQVISPGPLTQAHATLEGIRNCTNCHELGERGVSPARCLDCHTVLASRIRQRRGYHAQLGTRSCSECHKEHFGRTFALVRLDTARFAHDSTGYRLDGAHRAVACRACHRAAAVVDADVRDLLRTNPGATTYLGLGRACTDCHRSGSPHGAQFGQRACDECHTTEGWDGAERFRHERARYPLTGAHTRVACAECHPPSSSDPTDRRWTGLQFPACQSCHRDPHDRAMGQDCQACHSTQGWRALAASMAGRFDHTRTRFPLMGAHARVDCETCHVRRPVVTATLTIRPVRGTEAHSYPRPIVRDCGSCHVTPHDGVLTALPGGSPCSICHGQATWVPAAFDGSRHGDTRFGRLEGAHASTPCSACHRRAGDRFRMRFDAFDCVACHAADSPHDSSFAGMACDGCHGQDAFRVTEFDHDRARDIACRSCHERDDPHGAQFGTRVCSECHGTASFRVTSFDHSRTRFPLDGAHSRVACSACHRAERDASGRVVTRYRPLGTACSDCHGGVR
ncbi:MAG TPA: cytochrome c3 family protein [Longimicrobiales bacterium]|nr:cytochrome c3 family protein [Longimicrobiales bacterium]